MVYKPSGDCTVREGSEAPLVWTLYNPDGSIMDLSTATKVTLRVHREDTAASADYTTADSLEILAPATGGQVRFNRAATDLLHGLYSAYFIVEDGGKDQAVPEDQEFSIKVRPALSPTP